MIQRLRAWAEETGPADNLALLRVAQSRGQGPLPRRSIAGIVHFDELAVRLVLEQAVHVPTPGKVPDVLRFRVERVRV